MARPTVVSRLAAALLMCGLVAGRARATPALPELAPLVLECWPDVRLYDSLSAGTLDYCRSHLRYVPGALDCYQTIDDVCRVYLPATGEWTELHRPRARLPFPCPDGPEPPVCRRLDLR